MKCDNCGFIPNPGDQICINCGAKLSLANAVVPGIEKVKNEPIEKNNITRLIIIISLGILLLAVIVFLIIKYLVLKG